MSDSSSVPSREPSLARRALSWLGQGVILLCVFGLVQAWTNRHLLAGGTNAPEFRLSTLKGKSIALSQFRGRRVILHFWATWCGACKTNLYTHKLVQGVYSKDPILLSVLADPHNKAALQQIVKKHGITYPVLFATRSVLRRYRVNRFPTTYFLNKRGRIVSQDSGVITPLGLWWRSLWARVRS